MQTYLAVTPGEAQEASKYCRALAHVAYRMGPDSTLLRQNLLLQTHGGLLSVSDRNAPLVKNPDMVCAAVLRECSRRSYSGVLLDFEEPLRQDLLDLVERLDQTLAVNRRTLYLPERYAGGAQNAVTLICTAISGGTFSERLREASEQCGGAARLALDVQRLRMDFRLPARSGEGRPLNAEAFQQLVTQESPAVFFSQDLCARYFTYTRDGEAHFVLFDDADTLNQKLKIGKGLGVSAAFFMWPEVRDIAGKLELR